MSTRRSPRRGTTIIDLDSVETADLEASLRSATDAGQLRLVYQPEFDLRSGRVTAIEALVRWEHPRLGVLEPDSFISLAERSGLIAQVGAWVIDHALRAFAEWSAAPSDPSAPQPSRLTDGVVLRVNVSPLQLADPALTGQVAAALRDHDVAGESVCIELTEREPLGDLEAVAASMRRLSELGVSSAIDDLATGYSTLSNLRLLPFDVIKIDRSLVSGVDRDPRAQKIVAALIALGRDLEIGVVAEGVENDGELATLATLGCTRAQGHHLAKPMSAQAVERLLSDEHHRIEILDDAH